LRRLRTRSATAPKSASAETPLPSGPSSDWRQSQPLPPVSPGVALLLPASAVLPLEDALLVVEPLLLLVVEPELLVVEPDEDDDVEVPESGTPASTALTVCVSGADALEANDVDAPA
jgi:hypothetical protein